MEAAEFGTFFEPQRLRMNELRLLPGRIAERVAGSHLPFSFSDPTIRPEARALGGRPSIVQGLRTRMNALSSCFEPARAFAHASRSGRLPAPEQHRVNAERVIQQSAGGCRWKPGTGFGRAAYSIEPAAA